jgi:hypothetical protein
MPQRTRERSGKLALGLVDVRVANPTGVYLDEDLIRAGFGLGDFVEFPFLIRCWYNSLLA